MDGDYWNLMSIQFTGVALSRTTVEGTSHQDPKHNSCNL